MAGATTNCVTDMFMALLHVAQSNWGSPQPRSASSAIRIRLLDRTPQGIEPTIYAVRASAIPASRRHAGLPPVGTCPKTDNALDRPANSLGLVQQPAAERDMLVCRLPTTCLTCVDALLMCGFSE
jgi:hypothetical protein